MSVRSLIALMLLLAAAGVVWQQRGRLVAGEPRKCVEGQRVTYSNVGCPAGATERAVTAAPVSVVPATPVSLPAAASSGPSALHKALDVTRDDGLREKIMEHQIEGGR